MVFFNSAIFSKIISIFSSCSNNMMYPKIDAKKKILVSHCHNCDIDEEATTNMVYQNSNVKNELNDFHIHKDVISDPTLPRTQKTCSNCGHDEAVFIQNRSSLDQTNQIIFICCAPNCQQQSK